VRAESAILERALKTRFRADNGLVSWGTQDYLNHFFMMGGKSLPRCEMGIAYNLIFWVVRVESGLVPGDMGGLGFRISLFRFFNSPSKVPRGLMHNGGGVSFSRIGPIMGDLNLRKAPD
jgi:hypothetical protein